MASYQKITNVLDFAVSFAPSGAFPLDSRSMFGSYAAAEAAAKTAENAGSTNTVYYFGQILTVFENDVVTHYSIQADKSLKEVGKSIIGDNKTVVIKDSVVGLKSFGEEYYAYKEADHILPEGEYTYPDTMPQGTENAYVKVGGVWYKYSGSAWTQADAEPKTTAYYELTQGWIAGLEPRVVSGDDGQYALAWYQPSTTTVEGLQGAIGSLQTENAELKGRIDTVEGVANANKSALDILNSEDPQQAGSVKKQVADAIAALVANAPEDLNTLKEISDWISKHGKDAAAMNSSIQGNSTAIKALETLVGTLPENAKATDVIGYIGEAIATEFAKLGTAAKQNVEYFATAAQGAKADTAVQNITAGANGHIDVDGKDVLVYEPTVATGAVAGTVKPDGTSLNVTQDGTMSVAAVDKSKVTGLDTALEETKTQAVADAKTAGDEAYLAKTDVVASGAVAAPDQASDTKAVSEKAFAEAMNWKTGM